MRFVRSNTHISLLIPGQAVESSQAPGLRDPPTVTRNVVAVWYLKAKLVIVIVTVPHYVPWPYAYHDKLYQEKQQSVAHRVTMPAPLPHSETLGTD